MCSGSYCSQHGGKGCRCEPPARHLFAECSDGRWSLACPFCHAEASKTCQALREALIETTRLLGWAVAEIERLKGRVR